MLYIQGDDSSSGIGSVIYERANQALYDPTDTSHDDYITFTMKKQAKSPLVNPRMSTVCILGGFMNIPVLVSLTASYLVCYKDQCNK